MKKDISSIIEGRVIATPQMETLKNGNTVVIMPIVTNDSTGASVYEIHTTNKLAEAVFKYITKQQKVRVRGKLISSFTGFSTGIIEATSVEFITDYSTAIKTSCGGGINECL